MSVASLALTRSEVRALMEPADYLRAIEEGFAALQAGKSECPPPLSIETARGGFHAKAAGLVLDRPYIALKFNANFPDNRAKHQLPTIQGVILLCDGETGSLLAIIDSIEVTLRRTAAATALAAKFLALPRAETVLICGCGDQAPAQLEALREVLPLSRGYCWDLDGRRADEFAAGASAVGFAMTAVHDLPTAALSSDVIITCTTATAPFLGSDMVSPGTFIAAVGADNPHKSEITPQLMARARVVTDSTAQCAMMGDLHHAVAAGTMAVQDVHAELSAVVAGAKPGRTSDTEIIIFDSTGTAVQDAASAACIYNRAVAAGVGRRVALAA